MDPVEKIMYIIGGLISLGHCAFAMTTGVFPLKYIPISKKDDEGLFNGVNITSLLAAFYMFWAAYNG